jgi:hypothetical protein
VFKVLCFKNPLQRSRAKFINTGTRSHMSEAGRRVRVCDDAVFMVFARRAEGQAAGHLFFGVRKENINKSLKTISCTPDVSHKQGFWRDALLRVRCGCGSVLIRPAYIFNFVCQEAGETDCSHQEKSDARKQQAFFERETIADISGNRAYKAKDQTGQQYSYG